MKTKLKTNNTHAMIGTTCIECDRRKGAKQKRRIPKPRVLKMNNNLNIDVTEM